MDGFVAASSAGAAPGRRVMGHYDGRDLPFYWNVAGEYVLFDHFFASSPGGSVPNRLYWLIGTGAPRRRNPDEGFGECRRSSTGSSERGDLLEVLRRGLRPGRHHAAERHGDRSAQAVRVPLLNYARFVAAPAAQHIVDLDEYYDDLRSGTLPQVAYIAPAGGSEHPPRRPATGQTLVRSLVTALARSPPGGTRRSCGPTTTGAAGTTTCAPPAGRGSVCRRCW